ncbi:MAG: sugar-transfer associated ATP-grasp domain-containing protein [Agriterribacter sp.]
MVYYVVKTPWTLFSEYVRYVKEKKGVSAFYLYRQVIYTVFKYNASPLDYFSFRFYDLDESQREDWSCTGFMYEYQLAMNPQKYRNVLKNKILFLEQFEGLTGREWTTLSKLSSDTSFAEDFFSKVKGKVVIKNSTGQAGKAVEIIDIENRNKEEVLALMQSKGFDLLESYVVQHDALMRMSSAGLNTIRIVTQYLESEVIIILAFLRVSVNSDIDNLSADNYSRNFGCSIDLQTGKINKPGIYLNRMKPDVYNHPVTNEPIEGFQIPYWQECLQLVVNAARLVPENKSIGWDVAVTNNGPLLIEGNHNWNNLSFVPGEKGFRKDFLKYLSMLKS